MAESAGLETFDRYTPQETRLFSRQLRNWSIFGLLLLAVLACALNQFSPNRDVDRISEEDHFYYGSIGSDMSGGLPVKVLLLLPELFPQYLPEGAPHDLTAFGFIQEEGERLPIGFSIRRQIVDRTFINCGSCHTGTVRETPDSEPMIIPGMPAVTVDLLTFFKFLFDVAADENFTAKTILAGLDEKGWREPLDGPIYSYAVPLMKQMLLDRRERNAFLFEKDYPHFLPGRVNTFDTFKVEQFKYYYDQHQPELDAEEIYGIVDFTSVWNQAPREGMNLHWDGNQSSVRERNFSAAMGAGTKPSEMDIAALFRIEKWLQDLPAPKYPFAINTELAARGEPIYAARCAECHDFGAPKTGTIEPLAKIGTDPYRLYSYTNTVREAQMDHTKGHFWQFKNFKVSNGYSSHPLDGIWARAPYLHNGSVPTMWDLLSDEAARPQAFEVGVDVYDKAKMGFTGAQLKPASGGGFNGKDGSLYVGKAMILDTRTKANSAKGHSGPDYGTNLSAADKYALIEFLKTK